MAISTGGVLVEWGEPQHCLQRLMTQIRQLAAASENAEDYVVDLALHSWDPRRQPEFHGVQPGPVGRTQRRFIVWHSVPSGLDADDRLRDWFTSVLPEAARLCREHLPTKSRAYPAEDLAQEVETLRERPCSACHRQPDKGEAPPPERPATGEDTDHEPARGGAHGRSGSPGPRPARRRAPHRPTGLHHRLPDACSRRRDRPGPRPGGRSHAGHRLSTAADRAAPSGRGLMTVQRTAEHAGHALAEAIWPVYDTGSVEALLGGPEQVHAHRAQHTLLALTTADGQHVYPAWQINGRDVDPMLAPATRALQDAPAWAAALWLVTPDADLDDTSPLDWARTGRDIAALVGSARRTALAWR